MRYLWKPKLWLGFAILRVGVYNKLSVMLLASTNHLYQEICLFVFQEMQKKMKEKKFTFTIIDDTDDSTLENTKPIYDFLYDFWGKLCELQKCCFGEFLRVAKILISAIFIFVHFQHFVFLDFPYQFFSNKLYTFITLQNNLKNAIFVFLFFIYSPPNGKK